MTRHVSGCPGHSRDKEASQTVAAPENITGITLTRHDSQEMNRLAINELLRCFGWDNDQTIKLAQAAATALLSIGLAPDAVLVWLDQVYTQPERFLNDPALAPLATAWLDQQP